MRKLLFSLFITVVLLSAIYTTISAQPTPVAPSGSGTEAKPWQMATLANLYWLQATDGLVPSPGRAARYMAYYAQTANIDASSTATWFPNGSGGYYGWSPIGAASNNFFGHYNGMAFTINGLYINRPGEDMVGLFGVINSGAVISNVGLTKAAISGANYVGGMFGIIENGTVTNSYTTGTVTGGMVVGGLAGLSSSGIFNNCFWDTQLSEQSSSSGGTGKNALEMRIQSAFTGWDFTPGSGKLSLPAAWFTTNFVNGFSGITIGSSTAGNIGIKAIPFNDPVTFNANGNLNLENDIDLNGQTITLGNDIMLNEASGRFYGTTGNIATTRNLDNVSALNVAGLGAVITTSANWTPNATPSAFYNIAIPDLAIDPIVNQAPATPAVCNDLAIASGAVLTIAPGKAPTVNGSNTFELGFKPVSSTFRRAFILPGL